ncbi:hypothetical protein RHS03_06349, partial [Rhizoctonia solani]
MDVTGRQQNGNAALTIKNALWNFVTVRDVKPAAISPSVEMDHTIIIPEVIGIKQQSERDLSYPRSPTPEDNMVRENVNVPISLLQPYVPEDHQIPALQAGSPEANVDPNLLAVAEELEHEYRFDQLIGDPGDHFADLEGHIAENLFDDIDFGLPDDYGPAIDALPHFHLPDDLEPEESDNEVEAVDNPDIFCAAFQEPDLICNAYIDAFVQKTLYGATYRALRHQLKAARQTILAHPDITVDQVAGMAQTIATVERRLGVNANKIITIFTLCPICKRRYSSEYIQGTDNNHCLNDGCNGILFVHRTLASRAYRKVPNLTYPYASPITWLRHMLSLPGMSELMQTWRSQDNDHGIAAPIPSDGWMRGLNRHKGLGNITDGWGWRSTMAGLQRVEDPETGDIIDESKLDPPIRFVSLPYGILFSLNTNWY